MLKLRTLLEQIGNEDQYYDLGTTFAEFKRTLDGSIDAIKQKFETKIGQLLNGKRVIAKASRGYKQYVKEYEFDIGKVTIEDRYGNDVIIAQDMSTGKPKEYYLNTKSQIKILGPATGQPSPQKGINPAQVKKQQQFPTNQVKKEETTNNNPQYTAYSVDSIVEDISPWLPLLLKKKDTPMVDFVKKIGWTDEKGAGVIISVFEIKIPTSYLKFSLTKEALERFILNKTKQSLKIVDLELDKDKAEYIIKIKKIYRK